MLDQLLPFGLFYNDMCNKFDIEKSFMSCLDKTSMGFVLQMCHSENVGK